MPMTASAVTFSASLLDPAPGSSSIIMINLAVIANCTGDSRLKQKLGSGSAEVAVGCMADADIMAVACPCHQCRPEWFRNGWWCPQEVRVAPVPPPASLWPRFGQHWPEAAHGEDDSDFAPFDAELRAVLEASLRTAAADRRYLEELEQAISRSIEEAAGLDSGSNAPTEPSSLAARCTICMEQKHDGIQCCCDEAGAAHFLCRECLPQYVHSELQSDEESGRRLMERRASGHCIRCPGRSQCEGFLQLDSLRPMLPAEDWSKLQATAEADENHRQWQQWRQHEHQEDPELLREALLRSMPNAVQCGGCGYGPIDHTACSDLDAHHGEWHGNTQISNQCPRCGWWQHDIQQWPRWDGMVNL